MDCSLTLEAYDFIGLCGNSNFLAIKEIQLKVEPSQSL